MRRNLRRLAVAVVVLLALAAGGTFGVQWWLYSRVHVSTEDAYVDADVALVTPRIGGSVLELPVQDNWQVAQGQLLVKLDPTQYELQLREAEAALDMEKQKVDAARARVLGAESTIGMDEAQLEQAQLDYQRIEELVRKKVAAADELDRMRTALQVARSRLEEARQEDASAKAALGIPIDAPSEDSPNVRQATAVRDRAALQLSYTRVVAPISGFIATRSVQVGEHVDQGQPLMRVVPLGDVYIRANFKETELTDVRIGQTVSIVADIYPGQRYDGIVDSLAPGTGAAFALLPPENATGNWIKVVQRVPVKIRLKTPLPPDRPLRVGLSVTAAIDVRRTDGPLLQPITQPGR